MSYWGTQPQCDGGDLGVQSILSQSSEVPEPGRGIREHKTIWLLGTTDAMATGQDGLWCNMNWRRFGGRIMLALSTEQGACPEDLSPAF